jgi:hypothetical protein
MGRATNGGQDTRNDRGILPDFAIPCPTSTTWSSIFPAIEL